MSAKSRAREAARQPVTYRMAREKQRQLESAEYTRQVCDGVMRPKVRIPLSVAMSALMIPGLLAAKD